MIPYIISVCKLMNLNLTGLKPSMAKKKKKRVWALPRLNNHGSLAAHLRVFSTPNRLRQPALAQHSIDNFSRPSHGSLNILY